ncbi:Zeta toxin domain [Arabidopsis suecica]|uniref:Zeta toxin domain n=2 Tax=Arabidopsis TaxID=3701 RepID=A0A8T2H2A5_ARASU|nr:Zeta toxin domain [Arabidopsis suecica]
MVKPLGEGTRDVSNGGCKSVDLTHLLLASLGGLAAAAAAAFAGESFLRRRKLDQGASMGYKDVKISPLIERKDSGRRSNLERFSHYVARQLGFEDPNEYPQLCKLANGYLLKTKGYDENVYEYWVNEAEADSLYVHLLEEFERCILTYFAFNWTQSSSLISQALSDESDHKVPKLKDFVMAATRKQRFERVTKDLKVTRVISTLVEEMRVIGCGSGEPHCTEVMSPVAHSKRSPVLLLMGGGMGAGKSTVLKDIFHESFWSEAKADAVVIEADAFKETDVIYRALSSRGHHDDMLQTAELVHQSSTDAASSLLVTALNEGRDVIMDGTLSWEPFVEQMIEMARNVHKQKYRMGVGYKVSEDGTITEKYWEEEEETKENGKQKIFKPYRIELVGVVCDAYLAVARGIRRALMVKRAVRVKPQLNSHKRFANAFPKYCELVDNARLYCTNAVGGPPRLIAWKDGNSKLLVDPEDFECLKRVSSLNPDAESIYELYPDPSQLSKPGSVWNDVVLVPSRPKVQKELSDAIRRIEKAQPKN